ncbi:SLAM family member 7-like [Carassius auratus]|uniref:SLAM family member 7-like n=1 Tax=Carassius auratus TaxID=7957 RepID=A0A6P6QP03_CARAU|nr:SLAM family member 7-like [Carassius auratus]
MEVDLLGSFILLLMSNTGSSAEISVFVQTGDSVQLDIQTQEQFEFLYWSNDKSENIVKYTSETKRVRLYKDRVDFNDKTFSLTLKNTQKTDSGLYTARTSGKLDKNIVTYRVSVIDAVEAPVLTVISNRSSSDSCTVNFTCRTHELKIDSSYQNNSCLREEVTSQNNTLILDCSEDSIICNHSNPVSWKEDRINVTQLCEDNERRFPLSYGSSSMTVLIIVCVVLGVIVLAGLVLYCCCKNKTDSDPEDDRRYKDQRHLLYDKTKHLHFLLIAEDYTLLS